MSRIILSVFIALLIAGQTAAFTIQTTVDEDARLVTMSFTDIPLAPNPVSYSIFGVWLDFTTPEEEMVFANAVDTYPMLATDVDTGRVIWTSSIYEYVESFDIQWYWDEGLVFDGWVDDDWIRVQWQQPGTWDLEPNRPRPTFATVPVPEPAAGGLLLTGAAAVGLRRRRLNKGKTFARVK